ncbi:MAG TPA: glycosyltransferase [Thermoanaerobaculia bacterium]|nr:glycosyltransferase [Thermoanaerobaculia bacterium]
MISLLVVNYRSAALAAEAIRSARAASSEPLQAVVVDNSGDEGEVARLRPHADVVVASPANLGYAGGINLGRGQCRGETVIVSNPDVVFFPRAVDQLAAALASPRYAVAGPSFYWDDAQRWLFPPADEQTLPGRAGEVLASRLRWWGRMRDRRRFRRRLAFWSLRETTSVRAISGAVMAIRLRDFDAFGGFDPRFPLYFEEIDFLRRVARAGREIAYVPAARCRHLYNQSAGPARDVAAAAYAASELAYFSKWYGGATARLLKAMERPPRAAHHPICAGAFTLPRPGLVVEASPLPSFATAAGHFPSTTEVRLPREVWESYKGEAVYLRAVEPGTGEVVATCARHRID